MDPTQAIIAPWMQLGVVGSVVIGLGFVCWALWRSLDKRTEAHMAAVEKCHATTLDITIKNIEAQNRMSDALDGNSQIMKAALEALKK
jgi:hypothetical protein